MSQAKVLVLSEIVAPGLQASHLTLAFLRDGGRAQVICVGRMWRWLRQSHGDQLWLLPLAAALPKVSSESQKLLWKLLPPVLRILRPGHIPLMGRPCQPEPGLPINTAHQQEQPRDVDAHFRPPLKLLNLLRC